MNRIINIDVKISKISVELETLFGDVYKRAVKVNGTTTCEFTRDLSPEEIQLFNTAVVEHSPVVKEFRLYDYIAQNGYPHDEPPYGINYKTQLDRRLHRRDTIIKGELISTEYFEDETETTPVLHVLFEWIRNSIGIVEKRISKIYYNYTDGEVYTVPKEMVKLYSGFEAISEQKRRRSNIIAQLEISVLGVLMQTLTDKTDLEVLALTKAWITNYQSLMAKYISADDMAIIAALEADESYWLYNPLNESMNIRQFIISELTL